MRNCSSKLAAVFRGINPLPNWADQAGMTNKVKAVEVNKPLRLRWRGALKLPTHKGMGLSTQHCCKASQRDRPAQPPQTIPLTVKEFQIFPYLQCQKRTPLRADRLN